MKIKRQKRVTLALSLACVLAIALSLFTTGFIGFATADDDTVYSQNFESLSVGAADDTVYQATGWAGTTSRTIVQSTATYLKAPYQFWDNGCQKSAVYTDTGRIIPTTTEGKDYTLTMRVKPYGDFKDLTLGVLGPDTAKNNSVIILNSGANGTFTNYVENSNFISGTAVLGEDGWYDINGTVKGTGGYVHFVFYMNVDKTRYAAINEANATGFYLETLKFADGDTAVYELKLTPGLVGNDPIFSATGLAGFDAAAQTMKEGINGKTLRAVYGFHPAGEDGTSWQTEGLYVNENYINKTLVKDKTYYIEFYVRPFGHVKQTYCLFNQVGGEGTIDSQIILNPDMTYSSPEYGVTKIFEDVKVTAIGDYFKVNVAMKGTGGLFKLWFNMWCSDSAAANANQDTGIYFDDISITTEKVAEPDPTEGEYKAVLTRNFNNDSLEISGGDAMFQTNGFAGVDGGKLTIAENGILDNRCLSAMYAFYTDNDGGGWQKSNLYLDSNKLGNTTDGKIYRWDMLIKPTGSVNIAYIGFQSEKPSVVTDLVRLQDGQAYAEGAASGSKLIKAVLNSYENGVYNVSIYMYGNGGYTFNFFNAHCTDSATANADFDSGILLDSYSVSIKKDPEPIGFNVTQRFYNTADNKDLVALTNFADIETLTVDGTALNADNYVFADGILTVKIEYLKTLAKGVHTIVAADAAGNESTLSINIDYIPVGEVYGNDFSAMPELSGNQDAKDDFFRNSWFDPANFSVYTEGTDNKVIKFVPEAISETNVTLFQTNPNEGRMHCLTKGKLHVLSLDLKPNDNSVICVRAITHGVNISDSEFLFMEIDLATGKLVSGTQSKNVAFNVTAKEDGWYRLSVAFVYECDGESYAYVQFMTAAPTLESVWYMDNFTTESEVFADLVSTSSNYDLGANTKPYAIIALNGFEIVSVKEGETVLVKDTDYTLEVTPTGSYRMNLTEAFCENYNLGDQKTITVTTTKNVVTFAFAVIDSTPAMADTASCDIAEGEDIEITADLKGYEIALITVDGTELSGSEYMYNANGKLVIKYNYLKGLTMGEHTFVIKTASGAQKTLTVTVSDSTPVFGTAADYDKKTAGDYVIDLNLFGKELTEVKFDETVLTAEQYSYADGKLTVNASVFAAKNAGSYVLTVTTVASASVTVNVLDVNPEFEGEYEVAKGNALVITVNLNDREIVSVVLGEFVLTADDYSYADGKLTINAEVLSELASGEQTVVLTTTGGSAQLTFTLKDGSSASSGDGCVSSLNGGLALMLLAAFAIVWFARKRQEQN